MPYTFNPYLLYVTNKITGNYRSGMCRHQGHFANSLEHIEIPPADKNNTYLWSQTVFPKRWVLINISLW